MPKTNKKNQTKNMKKGNMHGHWLHGVIIGAFLLSINFTALWVYFLQLPI